MDDATATRKSGTDLEQERAVWRDLVPAIGVLAVAFGAMFATDADGPSFASAAWSILTLIGAVCCFEQSSGGCGEQMITSARCSLKRWRSGRRHALKQDPRGIDISDLATSPDRKRAPTA